MIHQNPQDLLVFTGAEQTPASLSCPTVVHTFAFNPDEVKWSISNNSITRDTIGGRVVQLLSARVEQMTVSGKAGSRAELQRLALNLKKIMDYQTTSQYPVKFSVPSKGWNFKVYVQNVSSLGWDYAATTYPYELTLLVDEDSTGLTNLQIREETLSRLATGIGYVDKYHGGNAEEALAISETYLNSVGYLKNTRGATTAGSSTAAADAALAAASSSIVKSNNLGDIVVQIAATQLGVNYTFGTMQEGVQFDCSGFTAYVYQKATGHLLPHKASEQQKVFTYVSRANLSKGDLVFFWWENTRGIPAGQASHVGIYIGYVNGRQQIIDASSSKDQIVQRDLSILIDGFIQGGRAPSSWTLLPEWLPSSPATRVI
ncbi:MAG: C40 family peptidase [Candidatus Nitrosotenuis sp.]